MELTLIKNTGVPKGAAITPYAMMQKIFCVIEGEGARVFIGRKQIRQFIHSENAIKKMHKMFFTEQERVLRIHKKLTKAGPILITQRLN